MIKLESIEWDAINHILKAYEDELNMKISDIVKSTKRMRVEINNLRNKWMHELDQLDKHMLSEIKHLLNTRYAIDKMPQQLDPKLSSINQRIWSLLERIESLEAFCEELDKQSWFF